MRITILLFLLSSITFAEISGQIQGLDFPVVQERNYFCWAALTQAFASVRGIQKPQQCQVVDREQGRGLGNSCCIPNQGILEGDYQCNERFMEKSANRDTVSKVFGFSALSKFGLLHAVKSPKANSTTQCSRVERNYLPDCRKVNVNHPSGRMTDNEIEAHVKAGRPVGLFFQFGDYATGHFIWIAGIKDYVRGKPRYIINDPYEDSNSTFFLGRRDTKGAVYRTHAELAREQDVRLFGKALKARWAATGVGKGRSD